MAVLKILFWDLAEQASAGQKPEADPSIGVKKTAL
jgi:hypothetical protein